MMTIKFPEYYWVDTFTSQGLEGNPTAVCISQKPMAKEKMRLLANQWQCPVSVFVVKNEQGAIHGIRYFTPEVEIPNCGHGTLAAAYVLSDENPELTTIRFQTAYGNVLNARKSGAIILITYPKFETMPVATPRKVFDALGIKNALACFSCATLGSLFIEVAQAKLVRELQPDFEKLLQSSKKFREVVVMSRSDTKGFDVTLRSFCPWIGVQEDPAPGSIHTVLGDYWKEQLKKNILLIQQASVRGGKIVVIPSENAVEIGGECKTVIEVEQLNR